MTYTNTGGLDTGAAKLAQLGAIAGPLIPWLVWLNRRDEEPLSARDAAVATNFGTAVLAAFLAATAVRYFVPLFGFIGTVGQLAVAVAAVALCVQAYRSVHTGVPASYPIEFKVVKTHG